MEIKEKLFSLIKTAIGDKPMRPGQSFKSYDKEFSDDVTRAVEAVLPEFDSLSSLFRDANAAALLYKENAEFQEERAKRLAELATEMFVSYHLEASIELAEGYRKRLYELHPAAKEIVGGV